MKTLVFFLLSTLVLQQNFVHAQVTDNQAVYKSEIDRQLTIRKVTVLPFIDNVQGIYSRPLENHLIDLMKKSHRFDYIEANLAGPMLTPEDLESDPEAMRKMADSLEADAFFIGRVTKGPNGLSIVLSFFLAADKKLFAKSEIREYQRADINSLKEQLTSLHNQIIQKIPYTGLVLSRQGNRVTINLGKQDGIQNDQIVQVIQIIKVTRHPKFNFLISSEKEILGRVKLMKVDENLSFGMILAEKEKGAIQKESKVANIDFVTYPETTSLTPGSTPEDQMLQKSDSDIVFGKDAKPWVPRKPPTFGQVGARGGFGMYQGNMKRDSGSLNAKSERYPAIYLEGEAWVTPEFSIHAGLRQAIIEVDNPRANAQPSKLNQSLTAYELLFGYNWRLSPSIWGPRIEALVGYSTYRLYVDDSDKPSLSTLEYSGFKMGVDGSFPLTSDEVWSLGAKLFIFWEPDVRETPKKSGDSTNNTINQFSLYGFYKFREHIKFTANLDVELYSTSFSGNGDMSSSEAATSASQKHMVLTGGIQYMF